MRNHSRKIFPEFNLIIEDNDTIFKNSGSLRIELSTTVRFKFKKVWYETECSQVHVINQYEIQHKDRILVDLISSLVRDAYYYQQVGEIAPGTRPCKLQISEKERLTLKDALKYNNINNLI
jgi:hypothetical protein